MDATIGGTDWIQCRIVERSAHGPFRANFVRAQATVPGGNHESLERKSGAGCMEKWPISAHVIHRRGAHDGGVRSVTTCC